MASRPAVVVATFVVGFATALSALSSVARTAASDERAAAGPAARAPAEWKLVWADDFDGAAVDPKKWAFDSGNRLPGGQAGWGNRELQYYTDRPDNVFVRDGSLHIRAVRETYEGSAFTSARLKTKGLFSKKFGRFEIRAKLPVGKGVWPAIWMLPEDNAYGGWPASGEIDVMEARGQAPDTVLGTLHYGARMPGNVHTGKDYVLPDGGTIADFHAYALEWEPGEIRWYVDGRCYQTQNFWWSSSRRPARRRPAGGLPGIDPPAREPDPNPWPAPFDQPFHLLLNVAVGGNFLGNPDPDTPFPVEMVVDYVRVYDRSGGYADLKPRGEGKLPEPQGR